MAKAKMETRNEILNRRMEGSRESRKKREVLDAYGA
jgi:hypothetical protein